MKIIKELKAIKVNNQKIVKRFQFDLEMELFRDNSYGISDFFTTPKEYRFKFNSRKNRKDKKMLIKILEKLKYRHNYINLFPYLPSPPVGLVIYPETKEFKFAYYYFSYDDMVSYNKIPDYILDYKTFF